MCKTETEVRLWKVEARPKKASTMPLFHVANMSPQGGCLEKVPHSSSHSSVGMWGRVD
jgi:hypothetical protein